MSNRYNASAAISAAVAAGAVAFELRNSSTRRLYVEEVGITSGAATAGRMALARATAQGAGGTATGSQPEDPSNVAATAVLVPATYTTAPTVGAATTYMRRANLAASIGAGIVWQWGSTDRLIVPVSGSLLLVAIAATPATMDAWFTWSE